MEQGEYVWGGGGGGTVVNKARFLLPLSVGEKFFLSLSLPFTTSETFALLPLLFDQTFADHAIEIRERSEREREGAPSPGMDGTVAIVVVAVVVVKSPQTSTHARSNGSAVPGHTD